MTSPTFHHPPLKPCPFCGNPLTHTALEVYKCLTKDCFLFGAGVDVGWQERVDKWNTRA